MADRAYTNVGLRTFLLAMEEAGQWAVNAPVEVIEIACRALGEATCNHCVRLEE